MRCEGFTVFNLSKLLMLNIANLKKNKEVPKLFSVILDQGFMSITTLLTTIVLARIYDKVQYADLVLLFSISLFVLGFQSSIISKPYAININDFEDSTRQKYFQFNLNLKYFFTLCTILVFPVLYYISFEDWSTTKFFLFLLYVISYSSYYYVRETLLSERRTKLNLKYGVVCAICLVVLLGFIFFYEIKDMRYFLSISSTIYLLITMVYLLRNNMQSKIIKAEYLDFWKRNFKVGRWMLGSNFLFHLSSSIYPWLLLYITVKDDIAVYGVLMSMASLVNPLLMALSSYLLPVFVKINTNFAKVHRQLKKWLLIFSLAAFGLVGVGYFFGQHIISLVFGETYYGLGAIVIYPFIVQAFNMVGQPFKVALNAIKRTDVHFWVLIPRSTIAITVGYFLITKFGLSGVFYTMLIENLSYQLLNFVIYRRIIKSSTVTNKLD